jgi:hypothetical protein
MEKKAVLPPQDSTACRSFSKKGADTFADTAFFRPFFVAVPKYAKSPQKISIGAILA